MDIAIVPLLLVFARLTPLLLSLPLIGSSIPLAARGAFAFALALAISPVLAGDNIVDRIGDDNLDFLLTLVSEVLLGLLIGFLVRLLLSIAEIAGEMFALPLGLSLSQLLSNESDGQMVLSGRMMQMLLFLLLLSDPLWIKLVVNIFQRSFTAIPLARLMLNHQGKIAFLLVDAFVKMFAQALMLALPILLLMLFIFVGMGIASRIVPQINLLILGLPLQLAIGLLLLTILIRPLGEDLASWLLNAFEQLPGQLKQLLQSPT